MSCIYIEDDECDSAFIQRQRRAICIAEPVAKSSENIENDEPLNLSKNAESNKYTFHTQSQLEQQSDSDYSEAFEGEFDEELDDEDDPRPQEDCNELTDLSWLINFNVKKETGLAPLLFTDSDDETDSSLTKPSYSFSAMIYMAIEGSPSKRMSLKDIYAFVMDKFALYRQQGLAASWKSSVRHNLSYNKCFRKIDKSALVAKESGARSTSVWCINPQYRMLLNESGVGSKKALYAHRVLHDVEQVAGVGAGGSPRVLKTPVRTTPKITNVTNVANLRLADFYMKACSEASSDVDAANALLLIKDASKARDVACSSRTLDGADEPKKAMTAAKCGKKARGRKRKSNEMMADKVNLKEESDSERQFVIDSDAELSDGSADDRISGLSANTLRNALLELSRAAELIEDKQAAKTLRKAN